jgi:hypothetical protein
MRVLRPGVVTCRRGPLVHGHPDWQASPLLPVVRVGPLQLGPVARASDRASAGRWSVPGTRSSPLSAE